jgi:signal transduction histidine kinase
MLNNLSIKKKLLTYVFFIQLGILIIFSLALHKALELSTIDKIQSTLQVILLDITDDILEQKNIHNLKNFNEEDEYKYDPLYIRLVKIEDKPTNQIQVVKTMNFPKGIISHPKAFKNYQIDTIMFEIQKPYIISRLKFLHEQKHYILEVATSVRVLNKTLENLLYILLFIIPLVLIFATIGGYFLIFKTFAPIETMLGNLKKINATDLSKRLRVTNNHDEIDLLAKEINSLLSRLESSFEKITQFSSDASHELKTPLTVIRGELEIALRKERSSLEYKETLINCLDEVLQIQETIDNLLFLAKSKDHLENIEDEIYIDEITLEAGKELESFAKMRNIHLSYHVDLPLQITGHSVLLKIAIKNLIKNAIVYSNDNSAVTIKNYIQNHTGIISIEDKGIGIKKEEQKKIFERFYRTDKSRNKESGGTGLGMTICEKIVQMHNGKIVLNSEENIGTTIELRFPID